MLLSVLLWVFQDRIIARFVTEANRYLTSEVHVEKIDISIWSKFPRIALDFENVLIKGSLPDAPEPLANVRHLYFTFSPFSLLRGHYEVEQVWLEGGQVSVRVDRQGQPNYNIFKTDTTATPAAEPVRFNIKRIQLKTVLVEYLLEGSQQHHRLLAEETTARLNLHGNQLTVGVDGGLLVHQIGVGKDIYFRDKPMQVQSEIQMDLDSGLYRVMPSRLLIDGASFTVAGLIETHGGVSLDLHTEGERATLQTLTSLLPTSMTEKLRVYRSEGEVYFDGRVKGHVTDTQAPLLDFRFGCRNASFYHPDLKQRATGVYLTGSFTNGARQHLATSELRLSDVKGNLDGKPFTADFLLRNFEDPYVEMRLDATLDLAALTAFYPVDEIRQAGGTLDANVDFAGRLRDLKSGKRSKLRAEGELQFDQVHFRMRDKPLQFQGWSGLLVVSGHDLAVQECVGRIGRSDFALDGIFKNALAFLLYNDVSLHADASFRSTLLDLDELLSASGQAAADPKSGAEEEYRFKVEPRFSCALDCHIERLVFRRFDARRIDGDLQLRDQVGRINRVAMQIAGGQISSSVVMDARQPEAIEVQARGRFEQLHADSLFYVFENFGQDFLQDHHLKGRITSTVNAFLVLNSRLDIDTERLVADADVTIQDGELINFKPMQSLSAFLDDRQLAHLRFSKLENHLRIDHKTVYIPEMMIRNNAMSLSIEGTHTFDQVMDYRIGIPLHDLKRPDRDAIYGMVEDDGLHSNLFLTLKGTSDNFKVGYDTRKVKQKIKEGLKQEAKEFRDLFGGKQQARQAEPKDTTKAADEGEFFDF